MRLKGNGMRRDEVGGQDLNEVYREFFDALVEGGVERLSETAMRLIRRPMIVNDGSGRILFVGPSRGSIDRYWPDAYIGGVLNPDRYNEINEDYRRDPIPWNVPVAVCDRFLIQGNQTVVFISENGKHVAFVSVVFGSSKVTSFDLAIIELFAKALRSELIRVRENENSQKNRLLVLLSGENEGTREHDAITRAFERVCPGPYRLHLAEFAGYNDSVQQIHNKRISTRDQFLAVEHGGFHVLLAHGSAASEEDGGPIAEMLHDRASAWGMSDRFDDISQVNGRFFQARCALWVGRCLDPGKGVYRYSDFACYQIFALAASQARLELFIHPIVAQIKAYDELHGSNLLHTLYVYLKHLQSKKRAADELNVHPNTLTYRIRRIIELFGVDFSDGALLNALNVSLMAQQLVDAGISDQAVRG